MSGATGVFLLSTAVDDKKRCWQTNILPVAMRSVVFHVLVCHTVVQLVLTFIHCMVTEKSSSILVLN